MRPVLPDPIRAEAIRMLYVQARNSTRAAAVVTIYMLVTAWPYNGIGKLAAWLAVQFSSQIVRGVMLRRFAAVADADAAILRVVTGGRYAMLLTDYRLSGDTDGLDLIAELLRHDPEPKPAAVLITGDCDSAPLGRAHACGVPLLHKPVSPADLRGLLGLSQPGTVH